MTTWADLERELAAWQAADRTASFWWRDDDAAAANEPLERLFALAARTGVPLALAAIPASAEPGLARHLAVAPPGSALLQHGYDHRNHAPDGEKKWELGGHRPATEVVAELVRGWARLRALFGEACLPVLVPPWNRIAPEITAALPASGYSGLSTFGPRRAPEPAPGLHQVNCHIDLFRWKPARRFLGTEQVLEHLVGILAAQRGRAPAAAEPIGIMTHHLVHDEEAWQFLEALLRLLCLQPGACILSPRQLWGPTGGG